MQENIILKLLCSIPSILIWLYFIPAIGIILLITRCFVYYNQNLSKTSYYLLGIAIVLFIPKLLEETLKLFKVELTAIPYLTDILNADIYTKLLGYSKMLLIIGIILLVLSLLFKSFVNKLKNTAMSYIQKQEQRSYEIEKKNNLEMKIKQEKAKNTQVVICPYCGADNMITETIGKCKYCRRKIVAKGHK